MPIIKSAIKRMKQTVKRRERNVSTKHDIKTAVKEFHAHPSAKSLSEAQSKLDTAVKKGLLKKATVSRRKASLSKTAKDAGVKLETNKKPAKASTKTAPKAPVKKAAAPKKSTAKAKTTTAKKPAAKKTTTKK